MIIFPIEVVMVEAYNVRLPLLDRKDEIGNRDIKNNVKGNRWEKWESFLNRSLGKSIVRVEAKIPMIFTDITYMITLDNVKIVSLPP